MAELPKKLQDLFNAKEKYLNSQRSKLEKSVIDMQERLLNDIISDIVTELDTENGQIKNTTKNARLISKLEQTYESFNKSVQLPVIKEFGKSLIGLNSYNQNYFKEVMLGDVTKKRFDSVMTSTNEFLKARIGIGKENEITSGGFLDSFLTDRTLINDVKGLTLRATSGQMNIGEYKTLLKYKVQGNNEFTGGFERYYQQFAYDTFNEYDRTYGNMVSKEFGLDYAVYQGGIIDDSREFCIEHNRKVYTREEISKFGQWKDSSGKVPTYISKFPGYNPEIHCGGFNCRHSLTWVSKITAERLRPDLKEKKS